MGLALEPLVIAVDGGGSHCRASLFDPAGRSLGSAVGGSANLTTNFGQARLHIDATIKGAYIDAGLDPTRMCKDVGYLGLAGANIGTKAKQLEKDLKFADVRVSSDREIAIQGALGESDGAVVQVGTGSFFSTRIGGQVRNVGGWGFQLSDDCSGASLGRMVLRATVAAHDGLAASSGLTDGIIKRFGGSPQAMVAFVQQASPGDYGTFAKELVAARDASDEVAIAIFATAVQRMVDILDILGAVRIGPICLLGGLGAIYKDLLPDHYREKCRDPQGSALDGAFWLAKHTLVGADHEY